MMKKIILLLIVANALSATVISPPEGIAINKLCGFIESYKYYVRDGVLTSWEDVDKYDGMARYAGYFGPNKDISQIYSFIPASDRGKFTKGELILIRSNPMDWPDIWNENLTIGNAHAVDEKDSKILKDRKRPIRYLIYKDKNGILLTEWWYEDEVQAMLKETGLVIPPPTPYRPAKAATTSGSGIPPSIESKNLTAPSGASNAETIPTEVKPES
ncbi:MAG: hypothetical protein WC205_17335 [Opitutaceae bacterium]|jgi:hypothetical protein